jgi:hypothetical protein
MKTLVLVAALAVAPLAVQEAPAPPELPGDHHRWLQQLVGEWTISSEATPAPGVEPVKMESQESVRSIGGLWVVAESTSEVGGMPFAAVMTLGYDPGQHAFVGTWIDSMQPHLWTYHGTLDEARRVLTLESEGPSVADPAKKAKYRDVIEVTGPDERSLSSSVQGDDGVWTTFLRAQYRRKE